MTPRESLSDTPLAQAADLEVARRRAGKNLAVMLVILALVVVIYGVSIIKTGAQVGGAGAF